MFSYDVQDLFLECTSKPSLLAGHAHMMNPLLDQSYLTVPVTKLVLLLQLPGLGGSPVPVTKRLN
jgi:hypothetical protein